MKAASESCKTASASPSFTPVRRATLQRKCACGGTPGPTGECAACRRKRLQRERSFGRERAPASGPSEGRASQQASLLDSLLPASDGERARVVGAVFGPRATGMDGRWLASHLDAGAPLAPTLRSEMEARLGADLSRVRLHTDAQADVVAATLGAEAVTVGPHVAFRRGRFDSHSTAGRHLIAHELAHTVQQRDVSTIPSGLIPIGRPAHRTEREAERAAARIPGDGGLPAPALTAIAAPLLSPSLCGVLVEALAWGATSALTAAVAAGCTIGSVVTVGGLAIPCTAIVIATAGANAVSAVLWSNILKQEVCGENVFGQASTSTAGESAVATA